MSKVKVLVSDYISDEGIKILEKENIEVTYDYKLSREEFLNIFGEYDGIIVRSFTQLDKEALDKAEKLKVIGRAGTGYDNIDLEEASKKGIIVFNTPNGNTISAAEHTMALLLALSRNVPQASQALYNGIWDRKKYNGIELRNKTLGIIGLGRIGSRVAKYAQAFGMNVIANDPYIPLSKAENLHVKLVDFEEILRTSDFISLHTPLTDETYHILGEEEFNRMKENVRIINVARGKNIDTLALARAIKEGKVAGAALDVFEEEPLSPDHPILEFEDKVIVTCHLGGTTTEAMDNVSIAAAEQVAAVLKYGRLPEAPLNIYSIEPQVLKKAEPYLKLISKLGNFLARWKGYERISAIEIEYGGEMFSSGLKPFTATAIKEILGPVLDHRVNLVNAYIVARERGISIKESLVKKPETLSNLIRITIKTKKGEYSLTGTTLPYGDRMIGINGYRIDLNLDGSFIVAIYKDQPGVIGKIGTILGDKGVNIAYMQVGRNVDTGEAISLVQPDTIPSKEIIEEIKNELDLLDLAYIEI